MEQIITLLAPYLVQGITVAVTTGIGLIIRYFEKRKLRESLQKDFLDRRN